MARTGRPTKKTNDKLETAIILASYGLTDAQISKALQIDRATFYNWKKENTDFFNTIKREKIKADERVEKALYKRAIGFMYKETEIKTGGKYAGTVEKKRKALPDTIAAIFWLKNRQPDKWRDKPEPEKTEEDNSLKIIITDSENDNSN